MARWCRGNKIEPLVLVVEDEPMVRALAVTLIEELGIATVSAGTVREALAVIEDTAITLLFTDINLPDGAGAVGGLELARRARELWPDVAVIYTSGGVRTAWMAAQFVPGGVFLPKPYSPDRLITAVERLQEDAEAERS